MDTCHYTFAESYRTHNTNSKVNDGLWVIMLYQCRFISCNKCPTLVGDADKGEAMHAGGAGSIRKISVASPQFCCEPKTALKKSV